MNEIPIGERVAKLEVLTETQQKTIEKQGTEIESLKNINLVVNKLSDTVSEQGRQMNEAIGKLTDVVSNVKEAQGELKEQQKEITYKQQYFIYDNLKVLCKKINWKAVLITLAGVGGFGWLGTILKWF